MRLTRYTTVMWLIWVGLRYLANRCGQRRDGEVGRERPTPKCWGTERPGFGIWLRTITTTAARSWTGITAEHLAAAARLLEGEGTDAARRWFKAQETVLYQGHAAQIAQHLEAAARTRPRIAEELRKEAGYFRNNERRMNYLEMREEGWAIGSGMVESGVKQFKARFTGAGMRWSRAGAERLMPVRAAVMSRRFDELWQKAYILP